MKIAVSMWSVHKEAMAGRLSIVDFIKWAATTKTQGVELLDFFWKDLDNELPQAQAALKETGLPVACYAVGNNFATSDQSKREESLQTVLKGIDMAQTLGSKVVRVFAGDLADGMTIDDARGWIIEGLQQGAAYAEEKGIILALENHGKLAGRSDQVKGIIADVGSLALKSTIDTGNFLLVDQDPSEAVTELAPHASHIHFKDFRLHQGENARQYTSLAGKQYVGTVAGEGNVDLTKALLELKAVGYQGWLSVEFEGLEDEYEGTTKSINNLVDTLSKI